MTYQFITGHAASLTLAPKLHAWDLGLVPAKHFRADAGKLTLFKFHQRYRQFPVFGADSDITLIATFRGAIGLRGAIVDNRVDYAFHDDPAPEASGEASILAHTAAKSGLAIGDLQAHDLRLVAFPRLQTIGWAATVDSGAAHVATVVVAADPESVELLPLLYYTTGHGSGLADEVQVEVTAEDPASDIFTMPVDGVFGTLSDGSPLLGSTADGSTRLANQRVVLTDAVAATNRAESLESPIYGRADAVFDGGPGTPEHGFQGAFRLLNDMYALTDAVMAGRWESLIGLTDPSEFSPRLVAPLRSPSAACDGAVACVYEGVAAVTPEDPEQFLQPPDGPPFERVVGMYLGGPSFAPTLLQHEFGHFVDKFAKPGLFYEGHGCAACEPSCDIGTADESLPLTETFANLLALWYFRNLFAVGASSSDESSCDILFNLSTGSKRDPHNDTCRPMGNDFGHFLRSDDPRCPGGTPDPCDRPEVTDVDITEDTALCERAPGYKVDSFSHAFWELLHAETCSTVAPYLCTPLPTLAAAPAEDAIGRALLYAARVGSATYEGFADDVLTYISCNYGATAYSEANEVLCHHNIRDNDPDPQVCLDRPAPMPCEICGNGIREGQEFCDGGDLDGQTCESLGLGSGALDCDESCQLDISGCPDTITESGGSGPTTSSSSPSSSSNSSDSGGATNPATTGPGDGDGGCVCNATRPTDDWPVHLLSLLLLATLPRTRRPLVLLVLCVFPLAACSTRTTDSTSGSTTGPGSTSTSTSDIDPEAVPRRFLGAFHFDVYNAGDVFVDDLNDNVIPTYNFINIEIRPDHVFRFAWHLCTSDPKIFEYTWTWDPDTQIMTISADGSPSAPYIDLYFKKANEVTLHIGDGCDDLIMTIVDDDAPELLVRSYIPGELCANGEGCNFTLEWCDAPPPVCEP